MYTKTIWINENEHRSYKFYYKSYRKFFEHGSNAINLLETSVKCLSNEKLPWIDSHPTPTLWKGSRILNTALKASILGE